MWGEKVYKKQKEQESELNYCICIVLLYYCIYNYFTVFVWFESLWIDDIREVEGKLQYEYDGQKTSKYKQEYENIAIKSAALRALTKPQM